MSTIFAACIGKNDAGIPRDHERIMFRALTAHHSTKKEIRFGISAETPSGPITQLTTTNRIVPVVSLMKRFDIYYAHQLLGCSYSPATIPNEYATPPYRSDDGDWLVAIDGAIPDPPSGRALANYIAKSGWNGASELPGQYALVAINRNRPDRLFWAAKAKPLYGLFDSLSRGIRIGSRRELFADLYHPVRSPSPFPLGPYASGTLTVNGQLSTLDFDTDSGKGTLVLCGGGVDSLVAAWAVQRSSRQDITLLYIDYVAQAAKQEWSETKVIADQLELAFPGFNTRAERITTNFFTDYAGTTTLLDTNCGVVNRAPARGVASEWVPARNTVLAALGIAYAESNGFARIVTGINADAASAYPDNDWEWHQRVSQLLPYALGTDRSVEIISPLVDFTKAEIISFGKSIGIPWKKVSGWSCYEGGEKQCGKCSSCRFRRSAFLQAKVPDPTDYAEELIG